MTDSLRTSGRPSHPPISIVTRQLSHVSSAHSPLWLAIGLLRARLPLTKEPVADTPPPPSKGREPRQGREGYGSDGLSDDLSDGPPTTHQTTDESGGG